ncbi:small ribosomal subunit protein bS21c [Humulus lupulus]|uniref:small ribosomal subunit protein bS21c n=1 Tax=Humulus lupulus TaxID=3486 RepID=UPI002B403EA1|nr:small ribosomal subunit protein bS21c [Humulus lupulus]
MAASSPTLSKLLASLLPSPSPPQQSPPSWLLSLPQNVKFPKIASSWSQPEIYSSSSIEIAAVAFPSLANSNTLFFKSAYNVMVIPEENEHEERLVSRFKREVFKAGVLQECRSRRYFETGRERRKRKAKEAAKRNRNKRFSQTKAQIKAKQETLNNAHGKKDAEDEKNDNWDNYEVELPY